MSNEPEVSKTGKWIDTRTGKVVTAEPCEGVLLVAPGCEIDPNTAEAIARAESTEPLEDPVVTSGTPRKARRA